MRDRPISRATMLNFIVRRQLRLDPPYWTALILTLILKWIGLRLASNLEIKTFPPLGEMGAHFLYLQQFAGFEPILIVAWTLCLEIQFYLIFIVLLGLSALGKQNEGAHFNATRAATLVMGLSVLSLGLALFGGQTFGGQTFGGERSAWFIYYWYYFASGVLCYWAWRGTLQTRVFWGWMALLLGAVVISTATQLPCPDRANSPLALSVGAASTLLIYLSGTSGGIWSWGGQRLWQYLGRISYSLYLIHVPMLAIVMRVGYKLTGERPLAAGAWYFITAAICIVAAHALHVAVEKPSMRWIARFRRPKPSQVLAQ